MQDPIDRSSAGESRPAGEPAASRPHPSPASTASPAWAAEWGRLLRVARQVAGLSLAELGARTGLSKGYLSKLESGAAGAANPSRATLAALARALPSFRPLAHTLEPGGPDPDGRGAAPVISAAALDLDGPSETPAEGAAPRPRPVRLGWRELELLAALIALDEAALPAPITATLLARAIGRERAAVEAILDGLTAAGVVGAHAPARPGAAPAYRCAPEAAALFGVARLGDLLVLAAALIAAARPARATPPGDEDGE